MTFSKRDTICVRHYDSPCGEMLVGSYDKRLCLCDWIANENHCYRVKARLERFLHAEYYASPHNVTDMACRQLDEFFEGKRLSFSVPLLFVGTDFQKAVWNYLTHIPYGTTISYGRLAAALETPKAVRAVANANGANAISIFAPCHRVIGANNSLTGYAGGLQAKSFLLNLEEAVCRKKGITKFEYLLPD